jgi:hypothetical protein
MHNCSGKPIGELKKKNQQPAQETSLNVAYQPKRAATTKDDDS